MIKDRMMLLAACVAALAAEARADFVVRDVASTTQIRSLADAGTLLSGVGVARETVATATVINYSDEGPIGHFGGDAGFPGSVAVGAAREDFVVHVTAQIVIATAGIYTFGVNSDDGVRLRIDGGGGFTDVIYDDRVHGYEDHFGGVLFVAPGTYDLDLVYFEAYGQAAVELFAAYGFFFSWNDTTSWRLVGDSANGGIATLPGTAAVPEPASAALMGLGVGAVVLAIRRRRVRRGA